MANNITNRQMFFILFLTLTSFVVVSISKEMAQSAGTGSWFTIIITSLIFAVAAVIIVSLNNMYQGKMLFDYSRDIIGKIGSYAVSWYYIIYFLVFTVFLMINLSNILQANFLLKTPKWATMLFGIPVFCFLAYKGITSIARMFEFYGVFFLIVTILMHIGMLTQGNIINILPLFNVQDIGKYFGAIENAIVSFVGITVLLAIPFTKKNGKKAKRTAFLSLLFIGLFYVLIVESCIMKIGINSIVHYKDALIIAIRDTELEFLDFLQRLDVLYLTFGFMGFFMGISIAYTVIVEYLCKIFSQVKRLTIVLIVGAVSFIFGLWILKIEGYEEFINETTKYMGLVSEFLIPALLLIVAKVRKHAA